MKDVLGNELHVGDLVLIQLERPMMFGEITDINEGGLLHAGNAGIQPGKVTVLCKHAVQFDPRFSCGAVLALRDDAGRIKIGSEDVKIEPLPN